MTVHHGEPHTSYMRYYDSGRDVERQRAAAFVRDCARRISVQTGERNVGGCDALYLVARALETGEHWDTLSPSTGKDEDDA